MSTLTFEEKIGERFPVRLWEKYRVCLAVSGGSDSVALLCAMTAIARRNGLLENLCVVTVNHKLRGAESDEEALFVEDLATRLETRVVIKNVDSQLLAKEARRAKSLESAARNARYQLLLEAAENYGARYIVTAHHQDDQIETILFRLMRGAGLEGITGMATFRPLNDATVLARPMLTVTRKQVLEYLTELNQDYRTDSSNASSKYVRNRIRNELVPTLDSIFPGQWQTSLLRHVNACKSARSALDQEVDALEQELSAETRRCNSFQQTLNALRVAKKTETRNVPQSQASVAFPLKILQRSSEETLRLFFRRVWRDQNWSVVDMGNEEWRRLAIAVKTGSLTDQFPGNIFLTYSGDYDVILVRKD